MGGQEGAPGNVLYAKGDKVWEFKDAKLEDVAVLTGIVGLNQPCFLTKYTGGTFTLRKFTPSCCSGPLVATNVTAFNYACKDPENLEFLTFTVKFSGEFGASGVTFEAIGHYAGEPSRDLPIPNSTKMWGCLDSVELFIYGDIKDACAVNGTVP